MTSPEHRVFYAAPSVPKVSSMPRDLVRWTSMLHRDSLLSNSFFLTLNTFAMGSFGFLFWIIAAHLFSAADVGIAATLVSAAGLISFASLIGLPSAFIAFLPTTANRDGLITIGIVVSVVVSLLVGALYVVIAPHISIQLAFLSHPWSAVAFVGLTAMVALNNLTDSVFIAFRCAQYNLFLDGVLQGIAKLGALALLVSFGTMGIFTAFGLAAGLAAAVSVVLMVRLFQYRPTPGSVRSLEDRVFSFSLGNYGANIVNYLPTFIVPAIIVTALGAASAAYFYTTLQVATFLYGAITALCVSLFAEGSQPNADIARLIRRATKALLLVVTIGGLVLVAASLFVLRVFGQSYESHGRLLLIIFAAGSVPEALNLATSFLLRLTRQLLPLFMTNVLFAATTCGLAIWWRHWSLPWMGVAWFIGNALSGVAGLLALAAWPGRSRLCEAAGT